MHNTKVTRHAKIIAARLFFYDLWGDDPAALRRYNAVMRTADHNDDAQWHQLLWQPFEGYSTVDMKTVMGNLMDDIESRFTEEHRPIIFT